MPRKTHVAEVEFELDPSIRGRDYETLTIYAAAEQTADSHGSYFDPVTGAADPGGDAEFDIHTVEMFDHAAGVYRSLSGTFWESLFGFGAWGALLDFLEGELEEIGG